MIYVHFGLSNINKQILMSKQNGNEQYKYDLMKKTIYFN
jgi:hypothetical protein